MQNAHIKRCFCDFPLVIARSNERCDVAIKAKPHFATPDSSLRYSQQLCLCIENLRFSPLKKAVATLISTFANSCKQVASLDIDGMAYGEAVLLFC